MQTTYKTTPAPTSETPVSANVTIVIPAYNEEHGIGLVLDHLLTLLAASSLGQFEIIVVDDGSSDQTAEVARRYSGVKVLEHRHNYGYGAALKSGIRHAHHDVICITDADGTYPNERIPELVRNLIQAEMDMVVGARIGENVAIPTIRKPAKKFINWVANYVAGEPIPDLNSGLRVFRRPVVMRFFNLLPDGFSFTTTITLAMLTNRYFVNYLPIDYHARIGRSKIRPIQDTINFLQLVLRIGLYFAPLKIFMPLSAILLSLALIWAVFSEVVLGRLADVSTMVIVMTGIQVAVIGLLAELINRRMPNTYRED